MMKTFTRLAILAIFVGSLMVGCAPAEDTGAATGTENTTTPGGDATKGAGDSGAGGPAKAPGIDAD
jgi:hypothetical protein